MTAVTTDTHESVASAAPSLSQLHDPTPLGRGDRRGVHLVRATGAIVGVYTVDEAGRFCAGRVIDARGVRRDTMDLDIFLAALRAEAGR